MPYLDPVDAATAAPAVNAAPPRPPRRKPTHRQKKYAELVAQGVPPTTAARSAGYSEVSLRHMRRNINSARGTQAALTALGVPLTLQKIDNVVSRELDAEEPETRLRAADLGYKRLGGYVTVTVNISAELDQVRGLVAQRLADRLSGIAPPPVDIMPVIGPSETSHQSGAASSVITVTSGGDGEPATSTDGGGDPPAASE